MGSDGISLQTLQGGIKYSLAKSPNHCCHGEAVNIFLQLCKNRQQKEEESLLLSYHDKELSSQTQTFIFLHSVNVKLFLPSLNDASQIVAECSPEWADGCPGSASAFLRPGEGNMFVFV